MIVQLHCLFWDEKKNAKAFRTHCRLFGQAALRERFSWNRGVGPRDLNPTPLLQAEAHDMLEQSVPFQSSSRQLQCPLRFQVMLELLRKLSMQRPRSRWKFQVQPETYVCRASHRWRRRGCLSKAMLRCSPKMKLRCSSFRRLCRTLGRGVFNKEGQQRFVHFALRHRHFVIRLGLTALFES